MLTDRVRLHCAAVAAAARHVSIDADAEIASGGISGLDETLHFLEGTPDDVARYVLILDTINFGSGWFGELGATTDGLTERLTAHARAERPWTSDQLRVLGQPFGETVGRHLQLTEPAGPEIDRVEDQHVTGDRLRRALEKVQRVVQSADPAGHDPHVRIDAHVAGGGGDTGAMKADSIGQHSRTGYGDGPP